ncbi:MAG: hypothetical protein IPK82_34880 [Polyangiaceae bacterium]|nr:hypothetical protein [Polyangiaceae bacterium]
MAASAKLQSALLFAPLLSALLLGSAACDGGGDGSGGTGGGGNGGAPVPVAGHPRLFVTENDLERLRSWATPSNPIYTDGLLANATEFKQLMDEGKLILDQDCENDDGFISCEWFMETFAFMSLVSPDAAERDDYAQRAKTILMTMIDQAALGPAEGAGDIRHPSFAVHDRSRGSGRSFGLTVDWIYPYLTILEKQKIREVFLRWCDENVHAEVTSHNHPEPVGVFNDPVLLQDKDAVRFASNNYFTGHARNLGFMAIALDDADDPEGKLHAYLDNSTGAFLYMTDYSLREDAAGGIIPEGSEYGPLTSSYTMELLFGLHTAGLNDPAKRGEQVKVLGNSFWDTVVPAYMHSMAPSLNDLDWPGPYHDYASFGDMETYEPYTGVYTDPVLTFGPLAVMAREKGDTELYDTIRWIELNMPPGGPTRVAERIGSIYAPLNSIAYFLLMDPAAPAPADPRSKFSTNYYAPGMRFLFDRTGWEQDDSYFTFQVSWTGIDHRHGDANNFGLHRKGEWITKEHSEYATALSALHNTVSIQNDPPAKPGGLTDSIAQSGSQVTYGAAGDGAMLAHSVTDKYAYALGDATELYNWPYNMMADVTHATRSIVWLKPDHVVLYDRAETKTAGRFKRVHFQTPSNPQINGNFASASTEKGQLLFVTNLLPQGAAFTSDTPSIDYPAGGEPMQMRLTLESTDTSARFLTVVQGADAGASADPATLITGTGPTAYHAAVVAGTFVAFPVSLGAFAGATFQVPDSTTTFIVTGLMPGGMYSINKGSPTNGMVEVTVLPGASTSADEGGVLAF